jgi:hypothetical protein
MRQIGCIVIGILAPFYFRYKMPMSATNLAIFTLLTLLFHLLLTMITTTIFKAVNQYRALNTAEVQVQMLQSLGTSGIINFVFAFGTRDDQLTTIAIANFLLSQLVFMPLSAIWINNSEAIGKADNILVDDSTEDNSQANRDSSALCTFLSKPAKLFDQLKLRVLDFHIHTLKPWLVRSSSDNLESCSQTLDNISDSSDPEDNPYFQQQRESTGRMSKTQQVTRFIKDSTQALMVEEPGKLR